MAGSRNANMWMPLWQGEGMQRCGCHYGRVKECKHVDANMAGWRNANMWMPVWQGEGMQTCGCQYGRVKECKHMDVSMAGWKEVQTCGWQGEGMQTYGCQYGREKGYPPMLWQTLWLHGMMKGNCTDTVMNVSLSRELSSSECLCQLTL